MDDTPLVADVTRAMLEILGVSVEIVNSGSQALTHTDLSEFSAILMDCQMPNMDGLETTKRLLEDENNSDLRIIAFSAHSSEAFVADCLAAGMVHHVGKPFSVSDLHDALLQCAK